MDYTKCRNEQEFKMKWIQEHIKEYEKLFCIETEETIAGFPDVLGIKLERDNYRVYQRPVFLEFKKARKHKIHFQPTQPAFYRKNKTLDLQIVALDDSGEVFVFPSQALFCAGNEFALNEVAQVDLTRALKYKEMKDESTDCES